MKCRTKHSCFLDCSESGIRLLADPTEPSLSRHGYWNICACAHVCQRQLHKYPHSQSCVTFFRLCVTEVSVRSCSLSLKFLCPFLRLHTSYITMSSSLPTHYNLDEVMAVFSKSGQRYRGWLLRWPVPTAILPTWYLSTPKPIAWRLFWRLLVFTHPSWQLDKLTNCLLIKSCSTFHCMLSHYFPMMERHSYFYD